MIIRVDADLALPVYEQIREQVTRMAVAGTLAEGTRMPTIRQLAKDLSLAKGTIAKAYALLEASGVVESKGHKGTFIAAVTSLDRSPESIAADLAETADAYIIAARQLGATSTEAADMVRNRWIDS